MRACLGSFAALCLVAGCATAPAEPPRSRAMAQTEPVAAPQVETRYYVDETGALWDDQGRRLGPRGTKPGDVPAAPPATR